MACTQWLTDRPARLRGADCSPLIRLMFMAAGLPLWGRCPQDDSLPCGADEGSPAVPLAGGDPVKMLSETERIDIMAQLRDTLRRFASTMQIIAHNWCNTPEGIWAFAGAGACDMVQIKMPDLRNIVSSMEAMLYWKANGMGAYLGGTPTRPLCQPRCSRT